MLQFVNPDAVNQTFSVARLLTKFGADVSFVLTALVKESKHDPT